MHLFGAADCGTARLAGALIVELLAKPLAPQVPLTMELVKRTLELLASMVLLTVEPL